MYSHILFFGYIIAAFLGMTGLLLIFLVQKRGDSGKVSLYAKTRNFVLASFLVEANYFLSFYKETLLANLSVGGVWRAFDYIFWFVLFYVWVSLMDEMVPGGKLYKWKKIFRYVVVVSLVISVVSAFLFLDEYYFIESSLGRIVMLGANTLFSIAAFIIMGIYLYKGFGTISNSLSRNYLLAVTLFLILFQINNSIIDNGLHLGIFGQSAWEMQIFDPTWIFFIATNLATIIFVYRADFSPRYFAESYEEEMGDTPMSPEDVELAKLNLVAEQHGLTQREREILLLAYQGMTNPDISERLYISLNTVKKHMHSIFEKLDVSTRMELAHLVNAQKLKKYPNG